MKIAGTSNFGDETFSEFFVISDEPFNIVIERLKNDERSSVFYKLVGDAYELKTWEP